MDLKIVAKLKKPATSHQLYNQHTVQISVVFYLGSEELISHTTWSNFVQDYWRTSSSYKFDQWDQGRTTSLSQEDKGETEFSTSNELFYFSVIYSPMLSHFWKITG